jgi:uncharacterized protein YjiS (DUF1127 family)
MAHAIGWSMTTSQGWRPLAQLRTLLAKARRRSRDRAALAMLDDRDLRDLGVSRAVLAYELNKPFWRD